MPLLRRRSSADSCSSWWCCRCASAAHPRTMSPTAAPRETRSPELTHTLLAAIAAGSRFFHRPGCKLLLRLRQIPCRIGIIGLPAQVRADGVTKSVNKVILIGNLGKDPEVKYTPSGTPVAKFTLATNERYKDKDGQWQDRTEWHNIVAWQRTAEIAGEYLKKGRSVYIEGRLQTHSWDDKTSGQKKYMTEIVVSDLVLLGGGREAGEGSTAGRTR